MKLNIKKKEKKEKKKEKRKIDLFCKIDFFYIGIILIGILCICIVPVTFQNDTFYHKAL